MSPPPPLYPDGSNEAVRQEATPSRKRVRKDCQSSPSRVAKTKKGDLHFKSMDIAVLTLLQVEEVGLLH